MGQLVLSPAVMFNPPIRVILLFHFFFRFFITSSVYRLQQQITVPIEDASSELALDLRVASSVLPLTSGQLLIYIDLDYELLFVYDIAQTSLQQF